MYRRYHPLPTPLSSRVPIPPWTCWPHDYDNHNNSSEKSARLAQGNTFDLPPLPSPRWLLLMPRMPLLAQMAQMAQMRLTARMALAQ